MSGRPMAGLPAFEAECVFLLSARPISIAEISALVGAKAHARSPGCFYCGGHGRPPALSLVPGRQLEEASSEQGALSISACRSPIVANLFGIVSSAEVRGIALVYLVPCQRRGDAASGFGRTEYRGHRAILGVPL
jgi:hypothetical protein